LRVRVHNFTQLGLRADILCPFIWNRASGLIQFRDGCDKGKACMHQILYRSRKSITETPVVIKQALGESMIRTWFEWHAPFRAYRRGETGEEQSQERADHFL
jgi:hypothetical protein